MSLQSEVSSADEVLRLIEQVSEKNFLPIIGPRKFADNAGIFADQMGEYLDYVRNSGRYRSRYIQVEEDGIEISIKL
jgi:hypothetical protein